jgi:hypothetical protein
VSKSVLEPSEIVRIVPGMGRCRFAMETLGLVVEVGAMDWL